MNDQRTSSDDQPVTLQVGARSVTAETAPLRAAGANFRTTTLAEPAAGCLEVRPSWGLRLFGLGFALAGLIPFGILYAMQPADVYTPLLLGGMGAVFVAVGLLLLLFGYRARFDRNNGEMTYGFIGFGRTRPLAEVLAVQLIDGGYNDSSDGPRYRTWQLNLVLDDASQPRVCLTNHTNLSWTRWAGGRLADFLDVPLLDQLPPGK